MKGIPGKHPGLLGRMFASALLVLVAGVAGAVGAAHAQQLQASHIGGVGAAAHFESH